MWETDLMGAFPKPQAGGPAPSGSGLVTVAWVPESQVLALKVSTWEWHVKMSTPIPLAKLSQWPHLTLSGQRNTTLPHAWKEERWNYLVNGFKDGRGQLLF